MNAKREIEVCNSPSLFHLYDHDGCIIVVIDILRATSSICVAFDHGAEKIIPVADIEGAQKYISQGFVIAGERDGEIIPGFDFGNSPFSFMGENVRGKSIA